MGLGMSEKAIGGYFELEIPQAKTDFHPRAHKFQSARAAFYALLLAGKPKKVWMPRYICDSMLAPLEKARIEYDFYCISDDFQIKGDLRLAKNEWLFYVNYFGICANQQKQIMDMFDPCQIVFDHSQAFFSKPLDCLATLYSPRKFFGIPDGGLLITEVPIDAPLEIDEGSFQRTTHLLKRLAGPPEPGYADYQASEETLEDFLPKRISSLTERLLQSIDMDTVRSRRNENFSLMHRELGSNNGLNFDLNTIDGPLCYPFLGKSTSLRYSLLQERVFVATYWPDVIVRASENSTERKFIKHLLPLPCDQRYRKNDLIKIIDTCILNGQVV